MLGTGGGAAYFNVLLLLSRVRFPVNVKMPGWMPGSRVDLFGVHSPRSEYPYHSGCRFQRNSLRWPPQWCLHWCRNSSVPSASSCSSPPLPRLHQYCSISGHCSRLQGKGRHRQQGRCPGHLRRYTGDIRQGNFNGIGVYLYCPLAHNGNRSADHEVVLLKVNLHIVCGSSINVINDQRAGLY